MVEVNEHGTRVWGTRRELETLEAIFRIATGVAATEAGMNLALGTKRLAGDLRDIALAFNGLARRTAGALQGQGDEDLAVNCANPYVRASPVQIAIGIALGQHTIHRALKGQEPLFGAETIDLAHQLDVPVLTESTHLD